MPAGEYAAAVARLTAAYTKEVAGMPKTVSQVNRGSSVDRFPCCSPNCSPKPHCCTCDADGPTPPQPQPQPGPFKPSNATNCTWKGGVGYSTPTESNVHDVGSEAACCTACFASATCMAAAWHTSSYVDPSTNSTATRNTCYLHAHADEVARPGGVVGCDTGRRH